MTRLLLVVTSSVALTCLGQTGQQSRLAPAGPAPPAGQSVTILVEPGGLAHQLPVPDLLTERPALLFGAMTSQIDEQQMMSGSQAGCPVQIVEASFKRPAEFMLTSENSAISGPTLRLDYKNSSGKNIDSVVLTGWIKVKDSLYELDSVTHPFILELSRKALLSRDTQATQTLKLADNALGLDRIELSQVNYADGSIWKPKRLNCVYPYMGSLERAKAW